MQIRITDKPLVSRFLALALIALLAFSSPYLAVTAAGEGISEAERSAISNVSAEVIRRVTGDRGAKYIADRFVAHGLKPLGKSLCSPSHNNVLVGYWVNLKISGRRICLISGVPPGLNESAISELVSNHSLKSPTTSLDRRAA